MSRKKLNLLLLFLLISPAWALAQDYSIEFGSFYDFDTGTLSITQDNGSLDVCYGDTYTGTTTSDSGLSSNGIGISTQCTTFTDQNHNTVGSVCSTVVTGLNISSNPSSSGPDLSSGWAATYSAGYGSLYGVNYAPPVTVPTHGSLAFEATYSLGGIDQTDAGNRYNGNGTWAISTSPSPGGGADLLNVNITMTLGLPANLSTMFSGGTPSYNFILLVKGYDGTILNSYPLFPDANNSTATSLFYNNTFTMPASTLNYNVGNWHNKNLVIEIDGGIYTGSWSNPNGMVGVINNYFWYGHVPQ